MQKLLKQEAFNKINMMSRKEQELIDTWKAWLASVLLEAGATPEREGMLIKQTRTQKRQ